MTLGFTLLGSGSSGNATLISDGAVNVLLDVGLSGKETVRRLGECGVEPREISAIVVSHEHGDHCRGVTPFARDLEIPVFISEAALAASEIRIDEARCSVIRPGVPFDVFGIQFTPFSVPHDAADPLAFCIENEGVKVAIVLDLGYLTNLAIERLKGCDAIVIESNHDVSMLKVGPYPWSLKQRVMSRRGHLSNNSVAEFLANHFDGKARDVVLAHLSKQNNLPELAMLCAQRALESRCGLFVPQTRLELAERDRVGRRHWY